MYYMPVIVSVALAKIAFCSSVGSVGSPVDQPPEIGSSVLFADAPQATMQAVRLRQRIVIRMVFRVFKFDSTFLG